MPGTPISGFLKNLGAGLRVALLQRIAITDFAVSGGQLILLALVDLVLGFFAAYALIGPEGIFNYHDLPRVLFYLPLMLAAAYLIARHSGIPPLAIAIPIALISAFFPLQIGITLILWTEAQGWNGISSTVTTNALYAIVFVWWLLAAYLAVSRLTGAMGIGRLVNLAALSLVAAPIWFLPGAQLWTEDYREDTAHSSWYTVTREEVFYAQPALLDDHLAQLLPGRKQHIDLYVVGLAGDASEDVFMNEVQTYSAILRGRFDTRGREVALINNPATVTETPIATRTGLARTLDRIGQLMDRDEDVLFMYLTSHGSKEGGFAIDFWPLALNPLLPAQLKQMLDDAGIQWKVIVVSACFSGTFIDALKDDNTVVITASDADHPSYGCGKESEFTYFGDAYFNQALVQGGSFIETFATAKQLIEAREQAEALSASNPQLHAGPAIVAHLRKLEQQTNASLEHPGVPR